MDGREQPDLVERFDGDVRLLPDPEATPADEPKLGDEAVAAASVAMCGIRTTAGKRIINGCNSRVSGRR